jgi:PTH2 family peptidyl-tRNA hydrolase
MSEERLTILANSNTTRGKFAAAAVHAALQHYGIEHGAVIVLGANPGAIERDCTSVVHDAGRTEVEPGTVTAGVKSHER